MNLRDKLSRNARAALLAGVLLAAGAGVVTTQTAGAREEGKPEVRLHVDSQPIERDTGFVTSFAPVVKQVAASVVSITTETRPRRMEGMDEWPYALPPALREFFGDRFGPRGGMIVPRQHGLGSGVIVTEDGYILTNNHVVDRADEIKVVMNPDGREYEARVVGRDPKSDLAVLKIDATGLPAIRIGDSDNVEVGDVVLAIGNPFGVGQTVTMGIVGATSRAVFGQPMGLEYEDFIQTDAAINPGNSGGALVDIEGRLIGINTAIVSRGGGNNGVGFAVASNLARSVMQSIVEHGRVVRGFLGVGIQDINPALAKAFNLRGTTGALVTEVNSGTPAARAGLKQGDVITSFDGRDVRDTRHLKLMVSQTPPEKEVVVGYIRDGKERTATVVLAELPSDDQLASMRRGGSGASGEDVGGLQGVVVGDLNTQTRQQFGIGRNVRGALVTSVDRESAAWDAGLREGDVITEINDRAVTDAESAIEAVRDLENSVIKLRVIREGRTLFLAVDESR